MRRMSRTLTAFNNIREHPWVLGNTHHIVTSHGEPPEQKSPTYDYFSRFLYSHTFSLITLSFKERESILSVVLVS